MDSVARVDDVLSWVQLGAALLATVSVLVSLTSGFARLTRRLVRRGEADLHRRMKRVRTLEEERQRTVSHARSLRDAERHRPPEVGRHTEAVGQQATAQAERQRLRQLQTEIRARTEQVAALRKEQEMLDLERHEVEAVTRALRVELDRQSRTSFFIGLIQNTVFFALGVVVSLII